MTALLMQTTRHLTTLLDEELKRQEGQKLTGPALRHFARGIDALAEITLSAWAWVRETLEDEGFEGRQLAGHCRALTDGIDGCLSGYERLLALTAASGLKAEDAGLPALEAKLPALREARPKVAEALTVATRPPRPIDEKRLAEGIAASKRGECIVLDDEYIARLRAGGNF